MKRITALLVAAVLMVFNCMPVLAASNVNMAGVDSGMLSSDYWLKEWAKEEKEQIPTIAEKAISALQMFLTLGVEKAMTFANQK